MWVRQVVCGNHYLNVHMISSLLDMKKVVQKILKIWACLKSNRIGCAKHSVVPGQEEHQCNGTTIHLILLHGTFLFPSSRGSSREPILKVSMPSRGP